MNTKQFKMASCIGVAALVVLFIWGIVFYKERILFADSAFKSFNIINFSSFCISENRYGSYVTELLPWLCMKLHMPAKIILKAYALSFNLFYLIVAALLVFKFKQYMLAMLLALYFFLFISVSYFWPNDEIHQAVTWMFLLLGLTLYLGSKRIHIAVILIPFTFLAFLTIYTHFIVIIPLSFLWAYLWIEKKHWPFTRNISILLSGILLSVFVAKFALTSSQSYDGPHLHHVTHFSLQDVIDTFTTPCVRMFFYRCLTNYWLGIVVFIGGLASLYENKEKKLFVFVILSVLGYIVIVGLNYMGAADSYNNIYLFHIETEWACISIIAAAPFVFSWLPTMKINYAATFLLLIFIVRIGYIYSSAEDFTWRTSFKKKVMAQMRKKNMTKLALYTDGYYTPKCILDWAISYETILQSEMDGDKPQLTFIFVNPDDKNTLAQLKTPGGFFNAWGIMPSRDLNPRYFSIDTTHPYQVMTYDELMK